MARCSCIVDRCDGKVNRYLTLSSGTLSGVPWVMNRAVIKTMSFWWSNKVRHVCRNV